MLQFDNKSKINYLDDIDQPSESIVIREYLEKYAYHYKWFIASILIALIGAFIYLRYSTYQYKVSTTILINDEENGGGLNSELSALQDLDIFSNSKTSLDTEMGILKSRTLMERVIKDLGYQTSYFVKGRIGINEVRYKDMPFNINLLVSDSLLYRLDTTFSITAISNTKYVLTNSDGDKITKGDFGKNVKCEFGNLVVTPKSLKKIIIGQEIMVKISPIDVVAIDYISRITIAPESKKSNLLILTLQDPIKKKAQLILDNLISHYNKDAIEDKNLIARNTDTFINNRIEDVSKELTSIDLGVERYKTKNNLSDMASETGIVLQSNEELNYQIVDLNSKIKLIDYLTEDMKTNKNGLMPSNLGMLNDKTSQNTLDYNRLILERNRLSTGSTDKNPILSNLNEQIVQLRESIKQSLINSRSSLTISLKEANSQKNKLLSKISSAPKKEREVTDIKRQQQIIETLYLYLLQKREENSISLAVTAPIAKVIDKAYGSNKSVSPKKRMVYPLAFLLGLIVPFIIIYISMLLDNKIHSHEDVEKMVTVPVLGDIPTSHTEEKVIISKKDRSNVAEAFRLLRTNINFMLPRTGNEAKTIFITSTIAGEGKTFIGINLATALVLLNKKVLLIGADIRKPKIATYLDTQQEKGLTHFLIDNSLTVSDVIEHHEKTNLDILETGILPPNPSELLTNGRFDEVIAYGKANYDYVVVDTAPINVVTDTLLLSHHADLFVYVVRANFLDKRLLKIPQMMNENRRLPNMAILINDTNYKKKGYGYGYGYGYGEPKIKSTSLLEFIKGKFKKN